MKDEEMAKEYTKNLLKKLGIKEDMLLENQPKYLRQESMNFVALDVENVTDGFLAGLKAGRPQWHKVADGDLPKENKLYFVAIKDNRLAIAYFNGRHWETKYNLGDFGHCVETVIAWCEIPTFDKE